VLGTLILENFVLKSLLNWWTKTAFWGAFCSFTQLDNDFGVSVVVFRWNCFFGEQEIPSISTRF